MLIEPLSISIIARLERGVKSYFLCDSYKFFDRARPACQLASSPLSRCWPARVWWVVSTGHIGSDLCVRFAHPHLSFGNVRTVTASLVNNASLRIHPHKHSYATRMEIV